MVWAGKVSLLVMTSVAMRLASGPTRALSWPVRAMLLGPLACMRPRVRSTFQHQRHAVRRCGLPGPWWRGLDHRCLTWLPSQPAAANCWDPPPAGHSCSSIWRLAELVQGPKCVARIGRGWRSGSPPPLEEGPQFQRCRHHSVHGRCAGRHPLPKTPGHPWIDEAGKGHPLPSWRTKVDAMLVQLHLSQNVASIGSLKDELCTPKPCQIRCIYIYIHCGELQKLIACRLVRSWWLGLSMEILKRLFQKGGTLQLPALPSC